MTCLDGAGALFPHLPQLVFETQEHSLRFVSTTLSQSLSVTSVSGGKGMVTPIRADPGIIEGEIHASKPSHGFGHHGLHLGLIETSHLINAASPPISTIRPTVSSAAATLRPVTTTTLAPSRAKREPWLVLCPKLRPLQRPLSLLSQ